VTRAGAFPPPSSTHIFDFWGLFFVPHLSPWILPLYPSVFFLIIEWSFFTSLIRVKISRYACVLTIFFSLVDCREASHLLMAFLLNAPQPRRGPDHPPLITKTCVYRTPHPIGFHIRPGDLLFLLAFLHSLLLLREIRSFSPTLSFLSLTLLFATFGLTSVHVVRVFFCFSFPLSLFSSFFFVSPPSFTRGDHPLV